MIRDAFPIPFLINSQNNIVNAERRGKRQVLIRPSSKVVIKFLSVMQRHGTYTFGTSDYQTFIFSFRPFLLFRVFGFGVITTGDGGLRLVAGFKAPINRTFLLGYC